MREQKLCETLCPPWFNFSSTVWYFREIHGVKKVNADALPWADSYLGIFPLHKKDIQEKRLYPLALPALASSTSVKSHAR
jgi:hypothetical protein